MTLNKWYFSCDNQMFPYNIQLVVIGDGDFLPERPLEVQLVLVELQQEDHQYEQRIHHHEGKDHRIAQVLQVSFYSVLKQVISTGFW